MSAIRINENYFQAPHLENSMNDFVIIDNYSPFASKKSSVQEINKNYVFIEPIEQEDGEYSLISSSTPHDIVMPKPFLSQISVPFIKSKELACNVYDTTVQTKQALKDANQSIKDGMYYYNLFRNATSIFNASATALSFGLALYRMHTMITFATFAIACTAAYEGLESKNTNFEKTKALIGYSSLAVLGVNAFIGGDMGLSFFTAMTLGDLKKSNASIRLGGLFSLITGSSAANNICSNPQYIAAGAGAISLFAKTSYSNDMMGDFLSSTLMSISSNLTVNYGNNVYNNLSSKLLNVSNVAKDYIYSPIVNKISDKLKTVEAETGSYIMI